jgi:hypothetical protein
MFLKLRLPSVLGSFMQLIKGCGLLGRDASSLGKCCLTCRLDSSGASGSLLRHTPEHRSPHLDRCEHLKTLTFTSAADLANSSPSQENDALSSVRQTSSWNPFVTYKVCQFFFV